MLRPFASIDYYMNYASIINMDQFDIKFAHFKSSTISIYKIKRVAKVFKNQLRYIFVVYTKYTFRG